MNKSKLLDWKPRYPETKEEIDKKVRMIELIKQSEITTVFSDNDEESFIKRAIHKGYTNDNDLINFIIHLHREHYKYGDIIHNQDESDLFFLCGAPSEDFVDLMRKLRERLDVLKNLKKKK